MGILFFLKDKYSKIGQDFISSIFLEKQKIFGQKEIELQGFICSFFYYLVCVHSV